MREQKLYICEKCGTQYKEKDKAVRCEKMHKSHVKINNAAYHACKCEADGYPDRVEIEFSDGSKKWYKK